MKIEISIEKDDKEGKDGKSMHEPMHEDLTPEQIAQMAARLKSSSALSRAERILLANYLLQDKED